jgi:hypothetical protein
LTHCLIAAAVLVCGCDGGKSAADVGPLYVAPAGTAVSVTVPGHDLPFTYVATPQRLQEIAKGFAQLRVGATREQVRQMIGPPDQSTGRDPIRSDKSFGWLYVYKIRTTDGSSRTYDEYVSILFDRSCRLMCAQPRVPGWAQVGKLSDE